jgi:hypothetical protein
MERRLALVNTVINYVRFKFLAAISMKMTGTLASCSLTENDRRSRGAYCLHHQAYVPLKRRSISKRLHSAESQKTVGKFPDYLSAMSAFKPDSAQWSQIVMIPWKHMRHKRIQFCLFIVSERKINNKLLLIFMSRQECWLLSGLCNDTISLVSIT